MKVYLNCYNRAEFIAKLVKAIREKDNNLTTDNLFILAQRFINSNKTLTLDNINMFLVPYKIKLSQEGFDYLLSITPVRVSLNSDKAITKDTIKKLVGKKQRFSHPLKPGVYVFRNTKNGSIYVGSSVLLNNRLPVYLAQSTLESDNRQIIKSLKSDGFDSFELDLYMIDQHKDDPKLALTLCRALEQYYILTLKPSLNTSLVAAGQNIGPWKNDKLKPLYVYNSHKTKLVCITTGRELGISISTLSDYLKSGKPSAGGFIFSRHLDTNIPIDLINLTELRELMKKAKDNRYKNMKHSIESNTQKIAIKITDLLSKDKSSYLFPSKSAATRFTKEYHPDRVLNTVVLSKPKEQTFTYKGWLVEL